MCAIERPLRDSGMLGPVPGRQVQAFALGVDVAVRLLHQLVRDAGPASRGIHGLGAHRRRVLTLRMRFLTAAIVDLVVGVIAEFANIAKRVPAFAQQGFYFFVHCLFLAEGDDVNDAMRCLIDYVGHGLHCDIANTDYKHNEEYLCVWHGPRSGARFPARTGNDWRETGHAALESNGHRPHRQPSPQRYRSACSRGRRPRCRRILGSR
jgi:hypothetical protein